HCLTAAQTIEVIARALEVEVELVDLPGDLAAPARPFLGKAHTGHQLLSTDRLMADLGYEDLVPTAEAIAATARDLAEQPIERGSRTEARLQDPFDYEAEDELIEAYRQAMGSVSELADAFDPGFADRYAPGESRWRSARAEPAAPSKGAPGEGPINDAS
ncbi:MAG: hypothetical protein AAFO29_19485, partial [Actinomycetota bacterium]